MMLMDDLQRPWWSAVELSAGLIQGGVLGIRMNSLAICRAQQWVLLLHCGGMLAAACYFRPCGAILSNVFLVASKAASFLIALCMLLHALTFNDNLASAANTITAVASFISGFQTACQLLVALVSAEPILRSIMTVGGLRRVWRKIFFRPVQLPVTICHIPQRPADDVGDDRNGAFGGLQVPVVAERPKGGSPFRNRHQLRRIPPPDAIAATSSQLQHIMEALVLTLESPPHFARPASSISPNSVAFRRLELIVQAACLAHASQLEWEG